MTDDETTTAAPAAVAAAAELPAGMLAVPAGVLALLAEACGHLDRIEGALRAHGEPGRGLTWMAGEVRIARDKLGRAVANAAWAFGPPTRELGLGVGFPDGEPGGRE